MPLAAWIEREHQRLLRQYLPNGTDLSAHSVEDLTRIAASLNGRRRKMLRFYETIRKLAELLAYAP